jgi:hypothetical protein
MTLDYTVLDGSFDRFAVSFDFPDQTFELAAF